MMRPPLILALPATCSLFDKSSVVVLISRFLLAVNRIPSELLFRNLIWLPSDDRNGPIPVSVGFVHPILLPGPMASTNGLYVPPFTLIAENLPAAGSVLPMVLLLMAVAVMLPPVMLTLFSACAAMVPMVGLFAKSL